MVSSLTFDRLMQGGLESLLNPAQQRREAGQAIPLLVARRLAHPFREEDRAHWADHLINELWPQVEQERDGRWDLGWAELCVGIALGMDLLSGELPARVRAIIEDTPAKAIYEEWRGSHQRFVLLQAAEVAVCRVFADTSAQVTDVPVEDAFPWRHEGPALRGRSHTLMLGLMAADFLPSGTSPLAAVGELDLDGRTVLPAMGVPRKAAAWWKKKDHGWLVTAPPGPLSEKDWSALTKKVGYRFGDEGKPADRWIVGGTLAEMRAKLTRVIKPITAWDGRPLAQENIVELSLEHHGDAPERLLNDALLDCARAACEGDQRGVLVSGDPGSGKSIWSRQIEERFRTGGLGAFGYGVRRAARKLAQDLERFPEASWSELLSLHDGESVELFRELERTKRLVPIVDGLDELDLTALERIANLLHRAPSWWIATSRPVARVRSWLPSAWSLHIRTLGKSEASGLLEKLGRSDLSKALFGSSPYSAKLPHTLEALTKTPFHVTLLSRAVRDADSLPRLTSHALYRLAFDGLLDQACLDQRISLDQAQLLRSHIADLVGALALRWLMEPSGYLDEPVVGLVLEERGFPASQQRDIVHTLEFGYLLARANDRWDFSHRTLAEWAAALFLQREALRRVAERQRSLVPVRDVVLRTEVERELLTPFLQTGVLPDRSPWTQLLRFYASLALEPLALLQAMVGPGSEGNWYVAKNQWERRRSEGEGSDEELRPAGVGDLSECWSFALDLMATARWDALESARTVWAIAVRRRILGTLDTLHRHSSRQNGSSFPTLCEAVAQHLPRSLQGLIELAARTHHHREQLQDRPHVLLDAIPPALEPVPRRLLEVSDEKGQVEVLHWYDHHDLEVQWDYLGFMLRDLPERMVAAKATSDAERKSRSSTNWNEPQPAGERYRQLCSLESAVWNAALFARGDLPWEDIRSRVEGWPHHLEALIPRWFGRPAPERLFDDVDRGAEIRSGVLLRLVESASEQAEMLRVGVEYWLEHRDGLTILAKALEWLNSRDNKTAERLLSGLLERAGEKIYRHHSLSRGASPMDVPSREIADHVNRLLTTRSRIKNLVEAVHQSRLETIVGAVWACVRGRDGFDVELRGVIEESGRPPACMPARELLKHALTDYRLLKVRWSEDHWDQVRAIADEAKGEDSFAAIRLLARREERDESLALVRALPRADEELAKLVLGQDDYRLSLDEIPTALIPSHLLEHLPLAQRAKRGVAGWKAELLALMARGEGEISSLATIAAEHEVREAIPMIAGALDSHQPVSRYHQQTGLLEAQVALCTEDDLEYARAAVRYALAHGWPDERRTWRLEPAEEVQGPSASEVLAGFLVLEDIDHLADGTVSASEHPPLAAALRALGDPALERLLELRAKVCWNMANLQLEHERLKREQESRFERDRSSDLPWRAGSFDNAPWEAEQAVKAQRGRLIALTKSIIAVHETGTTSMEELAKLSFNFASGMKLSVSAPDDHLPVYGVLNWNDKEEMGAVETAMVELTERVFECSEDDWTSLRPLLQHPSELLRLRSFELMATRAPSTELKTLVLELLGAQLSALRIDAAHQSQSHRLYRGFYGVDEQGHASLQESFRDAIKGHLDQRHSALIERLTWHEESTFRELAARWVALLSADEAVPLLQRLLDDPVEGVVRAALEASISHVPQALDEMLADCGREQWSSQHYHAAMTILLPLERREEELYESILNPRPPPVPPLSIRTRAQMALGAIRCTRPGKVRYRGEFQLFAEMPSLFEKHVRRFPDLLPALGEGVVELTMHSLPTARAVGRRLLVQRGRVEPQLLRELLQAVEPLDRISAAECLIRLGDRQTVNDCMEVLLAAAAPRPTGGRHSDALGPSATSNSDGDRPWRYSAESSGHLGERVAWALEGAGADCAPLLVVLGRHLPVDHEDYSLTREGEARVRHVLRHVRRWGDDGLLALAAMLDQGEVDDDYHLTDEVRRRCADCPGFRKEIEAMAGAGGERSRRIIDEVEQLEQGSDLPGVMDRWRAEIFPEGW
jgi:hypothetical protein